VQLKKTITRLISLMFVCAIVFWGGLSSAAYAQHHGGGSVQAGVGPGQLLTIRGKASLARFEGDELDFTLELDRIGRYRLSVSGSRSIITVNDGATVWRKEDGANTVRLEFLERETYAVLIALINGQSRLREGDEMYKAVVDSPKGKAIRLADGIVTFVIAAHPQYSFMAVGARAINTPSDVAIMFSEIGVIGGVGLPAVISIEGTGEISTLKIESAEIDQIENENPFKKPESQQADYSFDKTKSSRLEVRRTPSGHLLIHPLFDGLDLGWFVFDTGATTNVVTETVIEKLALEEIGKSVIGGMGGHQGGARIYGGANMQLGPLTIRNLRLKTSKGSDFSFFGENVSGVIGYDVLARAVVEMDLGPALSISLFDKARFDFPEENAGKLTLHWKVPYIEAFFEKGRSSYFLLDTGVGGAGVVFWKYAVDKLGLLAGKNGLQAEKTVGAGGMAVGFVKGSLNWFEIAGIKTAPAPASFSVGNDHESDLYSAGVFGYSMFKGYKVLMDYASGRIAFIKKPTNPAESLPK